MTKKNNLPSILIVDDKQENLLALEQGLASLDVEANIVSASSGMQALSLILQQHFALILLDVQMPEMNGFETAELLRANHETASTPVIFITAMNRSPEYTSKAYDIGVVDFLYKPLDKKVLLSKVKTFLLLENQRVELEILTKSFRDMSDYQRLLLDHADKGILGMDATGYITFANPHACKILGIYEEELLNKDVKRLFNDTYISNYFSSLYSEQHYFNNKDVKQHKLYFMKNSSEQIAIELSVSPFLNKDDQLSGHVLILQDITQREYKEDNLLYQAQHDSLTGLANRDLLQIFLRTSFSRNERKNKKSAVFFIDMDRFKQVNDNLGHNVGDSLLHHAAKRLKQCVRESDLIARQGGDEFIVVLDDIDNRHHVSHVADKITSVLSQPYHLSGHIVEVGISMGIAMWPEDASTPGSMISAADSAMYTAKRRGGNSFCFHSGPTN